MVQEGFRALPSVDRVLGHPAVRGLVGAFPRERVVEWAREALEEARRAIAQGRSAPSLDDLVREVARRADRWSRAGPRPVINATGVIIHTNLGRAPLSLEALRAVEEAARGYSDLEYDLEAGERGSRQAHVRDLLARLTGAEDALVVNNNAAAVLLGLTALARGREVIVSRGEAVEIGGGFRIPDVLRQSGATLVEVGTTNRTYISDYESAITPNTALLLKVHTSNFRITGFVHSPSLEELVALGRKHGLPVLYDLGSGCLLPTEPYGLAHEPTPQEAVSAGADLAFFSADKLLGGPQAGVIVGKRDLVRRLARHPLARAVRIDKLCLSALCATLLHYLKGEATQKVPVWRMVSLPLEEIEGRARRWAEALGPGAEVVRGESTVGGGSLPGETLPTYLVALDTAPIPGGAQEVARRLRRGDPPVIARIAEERVLLDPRTVLPEEEEALLRRVKEALSGSPFPEGG